MRSPTDLDGSATAMSGTSAIVRRRSRFERLVEVSAIALDPGRGDFWRDALRRRMLALADGIAAIVALASLGVGLGGDVDKAFWAGAFLPLWLLFAKLYGLYDRDHQALRHLTVDELPSIAAWSITGTGSLIVLLGLTPAGMLEPSEALQLWGIATAGAFICRAAARFLWRRITPPETALILGEGALADAARRKLELFPDIHVRIVGEVSELELHEEGRPEARVDRIIVASQTLRESFVRQLVGYCRRHKVKLTVVPPSPRIFGAAVRLSHVADLPVVQYHTWDVSRSTMMLKRTMDLVGSSVALLLLLPFLPLVAYAIKLDSRGPVFFTQRRAGLRGAPYRMYKLRTMVADAEARLPELVSFDSLAEPMFKLNGDPRVTRVGRYLRRSSIDELPQLWNVLKGEMSLVGPRPEQLDLVDRYTPEQRFRLDVKPGLTGPMQIFGRGELTFQERLAVEREYVENLSIGRDLQLLAMTLPAVFGRTGAF